ncbi:cadmium, cobalt and zinc/H(+)-K(+) antiporter [Mariprofundus micogutta]|uniref:Cadmium, cobalt and zinc/H(+)-K(+) antiporter n=1 Tax=Mariprofundus micogutta TaxID=1921010 RepID=A0A1L8CPA4_9PROT|nr:cadmium, cobalt and zinc/H(+)-K(+) antiporter [Mariprofundus micogutta]
MDCNCNEELGDQAQRGALIALLCINAAMFVVEFFAGWISDSTALIADSMDMLADTLVYAVSLYAVGRSIYAKIHAARLSGLLQIILGLGVAVDVIRRFLVGSEPESEYMIIVGLIALVANVICLSIIAKHRKGEIHMRASWIFSKNDVIANVGVIGAGVLVSALASPLPDLIIGLIISVLVIRGGVSILRDAKNEAVQQSKS